MPTEYRGVSPSDPITVTVQEAAARTGLSKTTIYDLANRGEIASRYMGRKRLIDYASLRAYILGLPQEPAA